METVEEVAQSIADDDIPIFHPISEQDRGRFNQDQVVRCAEGKHFVLRTVAIREGLIA